MLLVHYCPDNPTINIVTFRRLPTSLLNYSMSSLIQKCNNQYRWQHQTAQNCVFEGTKQLLNKGKFFFFLNKQKLNFEWNFFFKINMYVEDFSVCNLKNHNFFCHQQNLSRRSVMQKCKTFRKSAFVQDAQI